MSCRLEPFHQPELRAKFDRESWLNRHSPAHNFPRMKAVIDALKSQGVKRFGSTGYCYGGASLFQTQARLHSQLLI
jgi:dienelactone hydrolase